MAHSTCGSEALREGTEVATDLEAKVATDLEAMEADNIAKLSKIWHSNPQDEDGHALGFLTHATEGWAELARHRVFPSRCTASPWQQHGSDAEDPRLSCHSSRCAKLLKTEWYSTDITCKFINDGDFRCEVATDLPATRYHGTTLKAVLSMIEKGGKIDGRQQYKLQSTSTQ